MAACLHSPAVAGNARVVAPSRKSEGALFLWTDSPFLQVLVIGSLSFTVGCATKNYVRSEVTPVINNVNELDDQTAKNTRAIRDTDARAQQGIQQVNAKADAADQKALAAGQAADEANQNATKAGSRVTSLAGTVENLDNYKPVDGDHCSLRIRQGPTNAER